MSSLIFLGMRPRLYQKGSEKLHMAERIELVVCHEAVPPLINSLYVRRMVDAGLLGIHDVIEMGNLVIVLYSVIP